MYFRILCLYFFAIILAACGKSGGNAPSNTNTTTAVTISPNAVTLAVNNTITFTASGGSGSYSYSIFSGSGSILSTTGAFTAPGAPGTTVVRVVDGQGQYADAIVTVNSALQISPSSLAMTINATQTFSASGGVSPYAYSVVSGGGSINSVSGLYTAPGSDASVTLRVTDALGNTADASVSVFSALGIAPSSKTLAVNNTYTFSAGGGTAPYTFSVLSGGGTINPSTGLYTAPGAAGSATVRVTDNLGATADATVTINAALAISPASQTTYVNSSISFSALGGVGPYTFSILSGTGSINAVSGNFTAPASNGTTMVRVTDTLGNTSDATITVTTPISISPTSYTLAVNNTHTFTGSGGTPPLTYSIVSGGGSINASTGLYTAPGAAGSATVRVTDSLGATADAAVTINAALAISPASQSLSINATLSFSATGGVPGYTFSIVAGGGTINSGTGLYTAPGSTGSATVRVTDSLGNTSDASLTITSGLGISPAAVTLAVNNSTTFSGVGGTAPYVYSIVSGGGTINASSGLYTAPAAAGSATVRVTDNLGATADATVTINAALAISPASKTLAVNNTFTFSATGGVSPYTYSIVSGGGTINASSGLYTAPAAAGAATVRVTDNLGNTSDAAVTINAALAISPSSATVSAGGTQTFSASGGVAPYSYSVLSGGGTIDANSGLYTAPGSAGSATVRVTDSLANTSDATVTINPALSVSPTTAYVLVGSDLALSASGGVAPYSYAIVSDTSGGAIDAVTGVYTAGASTGSATLRTTDSVSATADTTVTIYNSLTLSPLTVTMAVNGNQTFTATGGVGARTFSVVSGTGTINPSTGVFTAPNVAETDIVQVADTIGNIVQATVTVVSQLTIVAPATKLPIYSTMTYSAILGSTPYVYSVLSGGGTINASSGLYTAPSTSSTGSVRVTDNSANTSDSPITHLVPVETASGSYHTCVRYHEGSVKCFGDGAYGQLGNGSTTDLGDAVSEQGGGLPFVNLGTGRTAKALSAGIGHTCAILDNDTVKCWGQNTYGQLGLGDTANRGDGANEMGDSLAAVNLGSGRTASKIFAFGYVTCVILDNSATKCFGRNSTGQLGLGDTVNRGTTSSQMGDNLAAVNLGTGRTAMKLSGGLDFACALLDNATVKCWGNARYGQTGLETSAVIGDGANEMGDNLNPVNLGTGRTAIDIGMGYQHSCAVLDNNAVKCWGRNQSGELGLNSNSPNNLGSGVGDMGDNLVAIPFNSFTAAKVWSGRQMSCAQAASGGGVRCWGENGSGQLLIGSTQDRGDGNNEMQGLSNVNFGTGVTASSVSLGWYFGCTLTTSSRIKCWGNALNGALLNGTTATNLGDAGGEVGDGLPWVIH